MCWETMEFVDRIGGISGVEKAVIKQLAWHKNEVSGVCYPSVKFMSERTCFAYPTIKRSLTSLEKRGLITKIPAGRNHHYEINMDESTIKLPLFLYGIGIREIPIDNKPGSERSLSTKKKGIRVIPETLNRDQRVKNRDQSDPLTVTNSKKLVATLYEKLKPVIDEIQSNESEKSVCSQLNEEIKKCTDQELTNVVDSLVHKQKYNVGDPLTSVCGLMHWMVKHNKIDPPPTPKSKTGLHQGKNEYLNGL